MRIHPRNVVDRVFDVWRSPGRFTKNPDMIQLPNGRMLFVYSDTDAHWSQEGQVLTIVASDDLGRTWRKLAEVARADLRAGDERLVTPRLSRLNDGRLVVICDHDDDRYFHEDQDSGNWAWWSLDGGSIWSDHQVTGVRGFEPDRIVDLPDGSLGVATHMMNRESQEFMDVLSTSEDGGRTWARRAIIAHDGYHRFCEGAVVLLGGGRLACVLRENHSAGIPCFVAFSDDCGHTWSAPQMCPFAVHRPYAKQLGDGRVLVTGRHVNGFLGSAAWCGDLVAEAGTWSVGGPRRKFTAELTSAGLAIANAPGFECRFTLLPPENSFGEVHLEATLCVHGDAADEPVAFLAISNMRSGRGPAAVTVAPQSVSIGHGLTRAIDMTRDRRLGLHHRQGLLEVTVDGQQVLRSRVYRECLTAQDFHGGVFGQRTQFGQIGNAGGSTWRQVSYSVRNPALQNTHWTWNAGSGSWPDQYQRDHLLQLHPNDPDQKPWPDHGYSSWIRLEDGRIFLVDYTNRGDEPDRSHIVGVYLEADDLP